MTDLQAILDKGGPWEQARIIGDQLLIQGDCLEVMPTLPRVDAIFTSPPYNCGKQYKSSDDSLPLKEYEKLLKDSLRHPARIKIVNVGQYQGSRSERTSLPRLVQNAVQSFPVDEVIWDKGPPNGAAWGNYPNSPRLRAQHESVLVFGNTKMPKGNGLTWQEWSRLTTSIWRIHPNVDLLLHPAMMPVELAEKCISLWVDVNGEVCDPFMGSGTTLVACQRLGRQGIGIELDESYFEIACRRVQEVVNNPPLFTIAPPKPTQGAMDL